jgi:hypothetical protein
MGHRLGAGFGMKESNESRGGFKEVLGSKCGIQARLASCKMVVATSGK